MGGNTQKVRKNRFGKSSSPSDKIKSLTFDEIDSPQVRNFIKDIFNHYEKGLIAQVGKELTDKDINITPNFIRIIRALENVEGHKQVTPEKIAFELADMIYGNNKQDKKIGVRLVIELYKAQDELIKSIHKFMADRELRPDYGDESIELLREVKTEVDREISESKPPDDRNQIIQFKEISG